MYILMTTASIIKVWQTKKLYLQASDIWYHIRTAGIGRMTYRHRPTVTKAVGEPEIRDQKAVDCTKQGGQVIGINKVVSGKH